MTRILKWLSGFTTTFWLVVVGVLAALLAVQTVRIDGLWFVYKGYAKRLSDCELAGLRAMSTVRKADAAAQTTVASEKALSGAEIDRAREAAAKDETDPWRAATDSMRKPK